MDLFRLEVIAGADDTVTLALFGRLTCRNLEQLDDMVTAASAVNSKVFLDLRSLRLIDGEAAAYLRRLEERGVSVVNGCLYMKRWLQQCSRKPT